MKYKIDWIEIGTTATGKPRAKTTLISPEGEQFTDVTIWGDFPNFANLQPGTEVEGDYKDDGKWKTLFAPRVKATTGAGAGGMKGVAVAQERKSAMIEKAQDAKGQGIMLAAAFRDATLLSLEILRGIEEPLSATDSTEFLKKKHKELVDWYISSWTTKEQSLDIPF